MAKELIPYFPTIIEGTLKTILEEQVERINENFNNKLDSLMCEGELDEPHSKKRRICCYSYTPGSNSSIDPSKLPPQPPIIIPQKPDQPDPPIIPEKPKDPKTPVDPGVLKKIYMILYWDILCFVFDESAWLYNKPNKNTTKGQFLTQQGEFIWKHEPPLVVKDIGNRIFFKYVKNHFIFETGNPRLEKAKPDYIPSFLKNLNNEPQKKRETDFNQLLEIAEYFDKIVFIYCNQKIWVYKKEKPNPTETEIKYFPIKNITTIDDAIVYDNGLIIRFEFEKFSFWHIPIGSKLSPEHKQYKPDFQPHQTDISTSILTFPF